MGEGSRNEKEAAKKLKKLDFSRFSTAHKNDLWQSLITQSGSRPLLDDELDAVAGGMDQPPEEPEKP